MEAGPEKMYKCQQAAFDIREVMLGQPTDSTPTTPPTVPDIDLVALCRRKREIINNLPNHCIHCNAEYPKDTLGVFVELRDDSQTIMAYCRKPGACGRSRVLFAGVDLVKPIYEQVCIFSKDVVTTRSSSISVASMVSSNTRSAAIDDSGNHGSGKVQAMRRKSNPNGTSIPMSAPSDSNAGTSASPSCAEGESSKNNSRHSSVATDRTISNSVPSPPSSSPSTPQKSTGIWSYLFGSPSTASSKQSTPKGTPNRPRNHKEISSTDLIQMHNPTCANCGKRMLQHHKDVDTNGWRVAKEIPLELPADWPVYDATTGKWS